MQPGVYLVSQRERQIDFWEKTEELASDKRGRWAQANDWSEYKMRSLGEKKWTKKKLSIMFTLMVTSTELHITAANSSFVELYTNFCPQTT